MIVEQLLLDATPTGFETYGLPTTTSLTNINQICTSVAIGASAAVYIYATQWASKSDVAGSMSESFL